jgi:hypothetical protein
MLTIHNPRYLEKWFSGTEIDPSELVNNGYNADEIYCASAQNNPCRDTFDRADVVQAISWMLTEIKESNN